MGARSASTVPMPAKEGVISDIINISESINEKNPRLLRGGAFDDHPADVRSANRNGNAPSNRDTDYGFRPARTWQQDRRILIRRNSRAFFFS